MSARLFQKYSEFEDLIIEEFNNRPFYRNGICQRMTADQVRYYLIQIGFIAQNFVKWYETAKLGLYDPEAKEVVRAILRSEIPRKGPTHQDDRFADLTLMGIAPETILTAQPTVETQETIESLFRAVQYTAQKPYFDLHVLIVLRVAGEILVSEQYKHVIAHWPVTLGLGLAQSRFFLPHMVHDHKEKGRGHTGMFDKVLARLICNGNALRVAEEAAASAELIRSSIHNQFIRHASSRKGIPGIPATLR